MAGSILTELKNALDGLMNAFLRCHGCKEALDCAKYPEYLTALSLVARKSFGPKIITICGCSRFVDIMADAAWFLERDEGAIVMGLHLLPGWYSDKPIPHHLAEHENVAAAMDELHLRKIDLSEEIFVVNRDGYVGESTTREINYAASRGIKIRWYTHDPVGKKIEERIKGTGYCGKAKTSIMRNSYSVVAQEKHLIPGSGIEMECCDAPENA